MAEIQNNYIESKERSYSPKKLNKINASNINFSSTINVLDTINTVIEFKQKTTEGYFNNIISWQTNFDAIKKNDRKEIQESIIQYIKDSENKNNILDKYLQYKNSTPDWIGKIIEETYTQEEIWEYELEWYFSTHDIISLWKEINGENWNGSNINQNNPNIQNIYKWKIFTLKQFIIKFNEINEKRINNNLNYIKSIDIHQIIGKNLNITKDKWILYINWKAISDNSIIKNEDFMDTIMDNNNILNLANKAELKDILQTLYTRQDDKNLYKEIYENTKESNENYIFHDSGLNFLTEPELADEETILNNFIKNTKPNESIENARANNPDLPKIMAELVIKETDNPDIKHEKSRLIYLLNNGLFRWFLMAINCLKPGGVDSEKSSPYLKGGEAYNGLQKHLNRYQTEKDENFFELINDINNLNINFNSDIIKHSNLPANLRIWPHLNNPWTKWDIQQVVGLAKSFFIQRLKDWETSNINIETYKNQLAYILATMQFECRYKYSATYKNIYYWYWQINWWYTWLWTMFAQGSWLDIWLKDKNWNPIVWADIKITKNTLTEKNFAGYAFVYWLTYGHLSNQWNLDKYINDDNIKNPDYKGARKIEAGAYSPNYDIVANERKKIINDSI